MTINRTRLDPRTSRHPDHIAESRGRRDVWLRLSIAAAALSFIGSVVGLVGGAEIYIELTDGFLAQAVAQDVANIVVVAPVWAMSAVLALRGSPIASIIWVGATAFTVYSYVIYAFSVPFGSLFPVWVTVLGLSIFALIGCLMTMDTTAITRRFANHRAVATTGWVLLAVAGSFGLLWLSEDLPALVAGSPQQSAVDMNLPTNPVHVLDYAFFLPAAIAVGVMLLRRRPFGYLAAPAFLVFMIFTCIPILITPAVQAWLGLLVAWTALIPVGAIALILMATVTWLFIPGGRPTSR